MLSSFSELAVEEITAADVVVVGSGAVGLTLALDLARSGRSVAVLEAGSEAVTNESQGIFESARSVGAPLQGLHIGRFRLFGGTTNFWGGQLVPFEAVTFGHRPWISDARWPINLDDLTPFYHQALMSLGLEEYKTDPDVWRALKIRPDTPAGLEMFLTKWIPEPNFARLFGREISRNRKLNVYLNATVVGLDSQAEGLVERVASIQVRAGDGTMHEVPVRKLVLAAGTIENIRILKLPKVSGSIPPWATNKWLGAGFLDHIDFYVGDVEPRDAAAFHLLFDNIFLEGLKYSPKLKLSESAQVEIKSISISAHFVFNSALSDHIANAKIFFRALSRGRLERRGLLRLPDFISLARIGLPMIARYLRYHRMHNPADGGIRLRVTAEQIPVLDSRVRVIAAETDANNMPITEVDWRIDGSELESIALFAERVRSYLEGAGLASVSLDPLLVARDPAFLETVDDANHHMGGARMAESYEFGVVDKDLKVFGSENLFVAGAAVYPTTGFANPTFTAIALGLRLSAHLQSLTSCSKET